MTSSGHGNGHTDGHTDAPRSGKEARTTAARLHAEGVQVAEIARRLGVARETVSRWVHKLARPQVLAAKEERDRAWRDTVQTARAQLQEAAQEAAAVLVAQLHDPDPSVAAAAARTILDRVGVPRREEVVHQEGAPDLSGLSSEELATLERLVSRAGGAS